MLTETQERNLRLLFDPRSAGRITAENRAAGAALLEEVGRLRAENGRLAGAAPACPAERCAALEADVGRLTAERDEARAEFARHGAAAVALYDRVFELAESGQARPFATPLEAVEALAAQRDANVNACAAIVEAASSIVDISVANVKRLTAERDEARATADRLRWALRSDADAVRAAADEARA